MNDNEKIKFLSQKYLELNRISFELETEFPEKSFKMDGIVVGNIVEVMAACIYGLSLYTQSEKTHDGDVDGRKVQVKGTQSANVVIIKEKPDFLLVEYLNRRTGRLSEIYNGPGDAIWQYCTYVKGINAYTITVNKLLEVDKTITGDCRIKQIISIPKFADERTSVEVNRSDNYGHSSKKGSGKTTVEGYINKNNQENLGCLHKRGTHGNQTAYQMKCRNCGNLYEANGCDIAIRRCPFCG